MSKITLYYTDLVELDARRQRSEIRQFVVGVALVTVFVAVVFLARG